jgi:hypothetical protein
MPNSALQRTRRKRRAAELVRSAEKFMNDHRVRQTELWAKLILSDEDTARIHRFFVSEFEARRVLRNMHITVYHSRRPIRGVESHSEPARVILPASETRFMVMSPGGEHPRPELDPSELTVGIRVHKQSSALPSILEFRRRLLKLETQRVLGRRAPSTDKSSAFGARFYQPHLSILRPGSEIDRDLSVLGRRFRETLGDLIFDTFAVDVVRKLGGSSAVSTAQSGSRGCLAPAPTPPGDAGPHEMVHKFAWCGYASQSCLTRP